LKHLARYPLLFALVVSCDAASVAQSNNQPSAASSTPTSQTSADLPQTFTSLECGFTIALPGTQVPEHHSAKNKDGQQIDTFLYTWVTNVGTYHVRCIDTPTTISDQVYSKVALNSLRDLLLSKNKIKPTREADISVDGYPGREIFLDGPEGIFIQRFLLAGHRAFDLNVYLPEAERSRQEEAIKILDSFKPADAGKEVLGEVDELLRSSQEKIYGACPIDDPQCRPISGALTGGALERFAVSLPKPAYPPIARAAHVTGTVDVKVIVDEEGKVIAAQVLSGHPLLQAVSVSAARQAQFFPTLLDGKPIKVVGVISYSFLPK
jgi:TonB family protein